MTNVRILRQRGSRSRAGGVSTRWIIAVGKRSGEHWKQETANDALRGATIYCINSRCFDLSPSNTFRAVRSAGGSSVPYGSAVSDNGKPRKGRHPIPDAGCCEPEHTLSLSRSISDYHPATDPVDHSVSRDTAHSPKPAACLCIVCPIRIDHAIGCRHRATTA